MTPVSCISVIVPCRNERAHVLPFCDTVAAQDLPEGVALEVLIADGRSDDGTREALAARAAADPRFRLIDNPGRIVSTGLNACIDQARGEVVARMDVHTRYADDYLAQCLAALERTGADAVGGPWRAQGQGPMQEAVALAFQSPWVSGGALSRRLDYEGPADTVYLGCWTREALQRYGGFDESLVRNQDDEHNLRIRAGGGKVWQSARIRSVYFPRARWSQLARQYLQYGYWKPFVMRKHKRPGAWRQLLPGSFVLSLVALAVGALAGRPGAPAVLGLLVALYLGFLGVAASAIVGRTRWALAPRVAGVIATVQLSYGAGSLLGLWDAGVRGRPRAAFGALTR